MKTHHSVVVAAAAWTAAFVLTVVATVYPQLVLIASMWAIVALAVAITASIAMLLNRHQYETVEDVRALLTTPQQPNGKPLSRI